MSAYSFFNRDTSWLSFNERVLLEAAKPTVPLLERIKFLSIYSSNLDEFYRVRMPVLKALDKLAHPKEGEEGADNIVTGDTIQELVYRQQQLFGSILTQQLLPQLKEQNIHIVYNEPIPAAISEQVATYFYTKLAAFIEVVTPKKAKDFFPENNKLYIAVLLTQKDGEEEIAFVNIPSDAVSRFYTVTANNTSYILFIDDIIKTHLPALFSKATINSSYSIKVTRDAELNIADEYQGDIAEKIEKQIAKRDFGLATRFLYQPGIPLRALHAIADLFALTDASMMEGGAYHNLKDFIALPVNNPALSYPGTKPLDYPLTPGISLFEAIQEKDILVHTPYQRYDTILRFFNEAAIDERTEEIYTTLYRVASDSMIVHALISAARNGKKVTVFVELKARFDEANNIKWAKNMKAAGVRIIYSIPGLKVHAKVALVKKKQSGRVIYTGLFATGNLNESTARFYTDHILLTAKHSLVRELELLFLFLVERKKPKEKDSIPFQHLLVAQFNLQQQFLQLVDREISHARQGLPAGIIIKLNNLEEQVLISKLYEASNAGVAIQLIVRGICCLIPGVAGMSEHITVRRIVDKYLEHGRAFLFQNAGNEEIYLGSSDWMNRNIYHRIEVCFPIEAPALKEEIKAIIELQLQDNSQAVTLDAAMTNIPVPATGQAIRSQDAIYTYLLNKNK